jgi:hypothetical protein
LGVEEGCRRPWDENDVLLLLLQSFSLKPQTTKIHDFSHTSRSSPFDTVFLEENFYVNGIIVNISVTGGVISFSMKVGVQNF